MKKAFLLSLFLLFSISCTQKTDMLSDKTVNEKNMTFPATRTTKRSPNPSSKMISGDTLESEHPTML